MSRVTRYIIRELVEFSALAAFVLVVFFIASLLVSPAKSVKKYHDRLPNVVDDQSKMH